MARYAMIRNSTGKVENMVEWDGNAVKWPPPLDCTLLQSDTANVGDLWDGSKFTPDAPPPTPDPLAGVKAQVRALMPAKQGDPPTPIDQFLAAANGDLTITPAQRDAVTKQLIRSFRGLVAIARAELAS